jgi:3-oxoacyl-[acyl-carrier protein] reductase
MFSLQSKTALITGAGSGIGASIADIFARQGARVFVTDRDEVTGARTAGQIVAAGGRAEFLRLDVTDVIECEQVASVVHERVGHLDILVTNAGGPPPGGFTSTALDAYEPALALNLLSVVAMCKSAVPAMRNLAPDLIPAPLLEP